MALSVLFYHLMFLLTSITAEITSKLKNKTTGDRLEKALMVALTCSIPAFFAGVRYGIGTDYFNYVDIFDNIKYGMQVRTEPGYNLINWIVAKMGGNEHVLFFVVSFMTVLFVYLFLDEYKDKISVGLGMFVYMCVFYNQSYNVVRQYLAMSICLYALVFLDRKQSFKYHSLVLLAISFHTSAIIMLPMYFLYNYVGKKGWFAQLLIYGAVILGVLNFDKVLVFVSKYIFKDPYYVLAYGQLFATGERGFSLGVLFIFAPYIILGIIFNKRLRKDAPEFTMYLFMIIIGCFLRSVASLGVKYLGRVGDYFYITIVWMMPYMYRRFKESKNYQLISYALFAFVILVWFVGHFMGEPSDTVPYISIWGGF